MTIKNIINIPHVALKEYNRYLIKKLEQLDPATEPPESIHPIIDNAAYALWYNTLSSMLHCGEKTSSARILDYLNYESELNDAMINLNMWLKTFNKSQAISFAIFQRKEKLRRINLL